VYVGWTVFNLHNLFSTRKSAALVTYRPSIAERIAWTIGQLSAAEVNVLVALWSCGDYGTGRNCRPYVKTIVARSGVSRATVFRTLATLRDPADPWIVAKRRHRHPTTYDICVDRLATAPPKEQQMTMTDAAALERSESHNETQMGSESQFETQPTRSESQIETPTSDPDLDLNVRTHTPRAREDVAEPEPALALLSVVPPPKCAHPYRHAWCEGRVHVPRDLHFEFLDKLGTQPGETQTQKVGRLVAFYAATMAATPASETIGDSYKFWKRHYVAWVGDKELPHAEVDLSRRELHEAETIRMRVWGRCMHEPRCATSTECIREIALARKVG